MPYIHTHGKDARYFSVQLVSTLLSCKHLEGLVPLLETRIYIYMYVNHAIFCVMVYHSLVHTGSACWIFGFSGDVKSVEMSYSVLCSHLSLS